jgi:hypothetical protein
MVRCESPSSAKTMPGTAVIVAGSRSYFALKSATPILAKRIDDDAEYKFANNIFGLML